MKFANWNRSKQKLDLAGYATLKYRVCSRVII
jgi:hypothetical protein